MLKKSVLTLGLLMMLLATGQGEPVSPLSARQETLEPYGSKSYVVTFKAHKRANVVVVGDGGSFLGLYVYDRHGNCICLDDQAAPSNKDDCAVEWYPSQTEPYTIEVRNLGPMQNRYMVAIQ